MHTKEQEKQTDAKVRLNLSGLTEDEAQFMAFIDENMVGQPDAKAAALRIYRSIHNPLREPNRPIFSAILAGESRSGKNHLVRLLCEWFHGSQKAHVKVNGGEFQEKYSLTRLIGAPHGYIGFSDTSDPNSRPAEGKKDNSAILSQHNLEYSKRGSSNDVIFVLLDEWEKMHRNVINLLLAFLDEGEGTLANNEDVNVRNVVFIMTSNMGMAELERTMTTIGFGNDRASGKVATTEEVSHAVKKAYKDTSSPEFRNRIDMLVVYYKLVADELLRIVELEFKHLQSRIMTALPDKLFVVSSTEAARERLLEKALEGEEGGLANLKRILNELVLEPLGTAARHGKIQMGEAIEVGVEDGEIVFDKLPDGVGMDLFKNIPIIGQGETVDLATALGSGSLHGAGPVHNQPAQLIAAPGGIPFYGGVLMNLTELMFLQRAYEQKTLAQTHSSMMADYQIVISGDNLDNLTSRSFVVVRDLTDLLGVKILSSETSYEKPFKVTLKAKALPGQIEMIQVRYANVTVNLVDDKPA